MIERIPKCFVNEECTQITLPFYKKITIFDEEVYKNGVLCHYDLTDDSQNINKYLLDNRKNMFPYYNIPIHKGLFGRYYINQLFEYNKHYISITNGIVRDRYLVKDKDGAVVLNRLLIMPFNIKANICSREYIEKLLMKFNGYMIFDRYGRQYSYNNGYFDNIDKFINNCGGLVIGSFEDDNIKLKMIRINSDIGLDSYIYREHDFSLNDYTIEELKGFSSKIKNVKDVCIHSCVNPNIDKKDIIENKRLVRKIGK